MRHLRTNKISSLSASSENANYPVDNLDDNHPSIPWKAADEVYSATITAEVNYGISDVAIFGTNAQTASVAASDPNQMEWGNSDEWGYEIPAHVPSVNLITNGTFDSASGWTLSDPALSIAGGVLDCDGTQSATISAQQTTNPLEVGKSYLIRIAGTVVAGGFYARAGGMNTALLTATGLLEYVVEGTTGTGFIIYANSLFEGTIDNVEVYEVPDLGDQDEWANTEITTPSVTAYQRSQSKALWLQLADTINRPAELAVTLIAPEGTTLYAGLMWSSIAETYGGKNPQYGVGLNLIDTSVSAEMSNGDEYYKLRNLLREINFQALLPTDDAFKIFNFHQTYGRTATPWKVTDLNSNEWVIFGRMRCSMSFEYPSDQPVNVTIREVL